MADESTGFVPDPDVPELFVAGVPGRAWNPPTWLLALDGDDRSEFERELTRSVRLAFLSGDPEPLEACLREWKTTGQALMDPVAREVLTGTPGESDFVPAPRPAGRHAAPEVVTVAREDAEFCAGVLADLGGTIGAEGQSVLRRLSASLGAPQPRSALPASVHPSGTPDGLTGAYSATTTGDDE